MAGRTSRQSTGILGVGAAACAACCAGPVIAFLAAASIGTLIGIALFGVAGIAVAIFAGLALLRRRRGASGTRLEVPVTLGTKPDA